MTNLRLNQCCFIYSQFAPPPRAPLMLYQHYRGIIVSILPVYYRSAVCVIDWCLVRYLDVSNLNLNKLDMSLTGFTVSSATILVLDSCLIKVCYIGRFCVGLASVTVALHYFNIIRSQEGYFVFISRVAMTIKTTISTHRPHVSLSRSLFCWWHHNRLMMTSQ